MEHVEAHASASSPAATVRLMRDGGGAGTTIRSLADVGVVYEAPEWFFERSVEHYADLGVGASVRFSKTITEADVCGFGLVTGDTNRLHFDDTFAGGTRFGGRVVHGMLTSGVISAALARLPGNVVYLSQTLEFLAPVHVDDTVTGVCEIIETVGPRRYRLGTTVYNQHDEAVLAGEAVVLVDPPA